MDQKRYEFETCARYMPAQRAYGPKQLGEVFKIRVEGDLEDRKSIYFTDQSPCFKIFVENIGEIPIELTTCSQLSFEESTNESEPNGEKRIHALLKPGEREEFDHKVDMLAYQGTAGLSVDSVTLIEYDEYIQSNSHSDSPFRLYTFMVYDKNYYKINYLRPRWTQYLATILSVIVVIVGVIQAYLVLSG